MANETIEKVLTLDDILAAEDVQYKNISVPEWKGAVRIGSIDAETLLQFQETNEDPQQKRTAGIRLIMASLVDADGKRLGDDKKMPQLLKKNWSIVNRLVDEILKFNGLAEKEQEKAKNGSSGANSGDSPTPLPSAPAE